VIPNISVGNLNSNQTTQKQKRNLDLRRNTLRMGNTMLSCMQHDSWGSHYVTLQLRAYTYDMMNSCVYPPQNWNRNQHVPIKRDLTDTNRGIKPTQALISPINLMNIYEAYHNQA
jgi:hypothetical protein